jgi:hypothetical protein
LANDGVFHAIEALVHAIKALVHVIQARFHPIQALLQAFNLGLQQIAKILEPFIYRIAEVVDAAVLEKEPEQVSADDDRDGPPLVDDWVHCFSGY